MCRLWLGIFVTGVVSIGVRAGDDEFRTVETAIKTKLQPTAAPAR